MAESTPASSGGSGGYDFSSKTALTGGNDTVTASSFSTNFGGSDISDQAFWLANSSNEGAQLIASIPTSAYIVAGIVALALVILAVRR
jgi:hypothetical protein